MAGALYLAHVCLPNDHTWVRSAGEPIFRETGSGLTIERSGTLNGSSPTANLAGVNIKGNEAFSSFPQFGMAAL